MWVKAKVSCSCGGTVAYLDDYFLQNIAVGLLVSTIADNAKTAHT